MVDLHHVVCLTASKRPGQNDPVGSSGGNRPTQDVIRRGTRCESKAEDRNPPRHDERPQQWRRTLEGGAGPLLGTAFVTTRDRDLPTRRIVRPRQGVDASDLLGHRHPVGAPRSSLCHETKSLLDVCVLGTVRPLLHMCQVAWTP